MSREEGVAQKQKRSPEQVAPDLYRIVLPGDGGELDHVNTYVIVGAGVWMIDAGYGDAASRDTLRAQLRLIGAAPEDIRAVFVTHLHPDHYGMASWLAGLSGAQVISLGDPETGRQLDDWDLPPDVFASWLSANGWPSGSTGFSDDSDYERFRPRQLLAEGSELGWGPYRFQIIHAPGHSPGMACLYDHGTGLFVSSDHVLPEITPHVGRFSPSENDPLGDYIRSLEKVAKLDVSLVLPGHGAPFESLTERVGEIIAHHSRREVEAGDAIASRPTTAYEAAGTMSWLGETKGWGRLEAIGRFMALTETMAHLRHLELAGGATAESGADGLIRFNRRRG